MSYPYGDENYPTIEQLEHGIEDFRAYFYNNLEQLNTELEHRCKQEARQRPIIFNITVNGDASEEQRKRIVRDAYDEAASLAYEYADPTLEQQIDNYGIAFARALASYGIDEPDGNLSRLFQDLFNVLEDKTISVRDGQMQEEAERRYQEELRNADEKAKAVASGKNEQDGQ